MIFKELKFEGNTFERVTMPKAISLLKQKTCDIYCKNRNVAIESAWTHGWLIVIPKDYMQYNDIHDLNTQIAEANYYSDKSFGNLIFYTMKGGE